MTIGNGGHAAGHHHPLHAGGMGKTQRPERTFAGRHDQIVGVLRLPGRDGRSNMLNKFDALHRFGPAGIAHQITGHQFQIGQGQRGAHFGGASEITDGTAHRPAIAHQRLDDEAGDIARCAGDQHLAPIRNKFIRHYHAPACRFPIDRDTN
jgi:hypothetical protein